MKIFNAVEDIPPPGRVWIRTAAGYLITEGEPRIAQYYPSPQNVALSATSIASIDAGLTLDQAHAALTDGLTKAELVEVGADLGLSLNALSLKAELLADIRAHLEGLDNG